MITSAGCRARAIETAGAMNCSALPDNITTVVLVRRLIR
jgi:hypothetical protein